MLKVAVIADDLTGAADSGIQFRRMAAPVYMISHTDLAKVDLEPKAGALSVYTNTRALSGVTAKAMVSKTAESLALWRPERVYKKIDSCMRGNVGPEADALVETLGMEASFIAPSFPAQGRTTVHDIHMVHGVPVSETEMRHDPVCPVTESRLTALVANRSRFRVDHVDLNTLVASPDRLTEEIKRLIRIGTRHIVIDAADQSHLDTIVEIHLKSFPNTLLVGSAGLARSLAQRLTEVPSPENHFGPYAGRNLLFVCGSSSECMRQQADELTRAGGLDRLILDPAVLADPLRYQDRQALASEAAERLDVISLILQIKQPALDGPTLSAGEVVTGLAELVADLASQASLSGLFLSGGDTATAVLERIGAKAVRLEREILPGMVLGTLMGGDLDDRTVVTKAGAFGQPDALVHLYQNFFQKDSS